MVAPLGPFRHRWCKLLEVIYAGSLGDSLAARGREQDLGGAGWSCCPVRWPGLLDSQGHLGIYQPRLQNIPLITWEWGEGESMSPTISNVAVSSRSTCKSANTLSASPDWVAPWTRMMWPASLFPSAC